jgi:hypothetical protein
MSDTTHHPAAAAYHARKLSLHAEQAAIETRRLRLRIAIAVCLGVMAALYYAAVHRGASSWPILLPVAGLFAVLPSYLAIQNALFRIQRLHALYDRNLARVAGTVTQSGHTGDEFHDPAHLYDRDLDILGPASLFGLLATTRTGVGQRGLARFLLDPALHAESLARQRSVEELAPNLDLREKIELLGASRFKQVSAAFFDTWLDDPPPSFHPAIRIALIATPILLIGSLAAGLFGLIAWHTLLPNIAAFAAIQGAICLSVRSRVVAILEDSKVADQMQLFSDGLALLQTQTFTTPKLQSIERTATEPADAVRLLGKIQSQFVIVEQRSKEYFFLFSILLAAGTHAAISIAQWKRNHASAMKRWLAAWAEFEALNALANYAFEHPFDTYPNLLSPDSDATFEAVSLGHPLLSDSACIRNDIALDSETRFYLISGSNMAGKSTLLRALGVNAVLAYAGAPVRAASARLSPLTLGASLSLTDSLAEGKSKFLAEVQRLQSILHAGSLGPTLFLVDELFSGTNSADRRTAASAVLHALIENGAIGALSTHDLALTELATPATHGINLHMASPDPADPLAFDFRLKPGINPSSNALAIIRMMGIET